MKLPKIKISELANADLNEREMCRLLGSGDPGCCQCGCHYTATTATNNSFNDKDGLTSDPGAQPCCTTTQTDCSCLTLPPLPPQNSVCNSCVPMDGTVLASVTMCGIKP